MKSNDFAISGEVNTPFSVAATGMRKKQVMNKALSSVQNIQKPSLSNSVRLQISLSITCVQFSEEPDNI